MYSQGFIDQNPDALRLTLIEGSLDRDQFTQLASSTRTISGIRIDATVIGASHVISASFGVLEFHEVFACVGVPGRESQTVGDLIGAPVKRKLPGASYEFAARYVPWQDPEPDELVELVALAREHESAQVGIVQEFERGPFLVDPKTVIVIYSDENGNVVIETAHSYPESGLVLSRSTVTHT